MGNRNAWGERERLGVWGGANSTRPPLVILGGGVVAGADGSLQSTEWGEGGGSPIPTPLRRHQDEKYWSRRSRNNAAARRSREMRRLKENQISARAAFLERENAALRHEVAAARKELQRFRALLARYEARHGAL